MVGLLSVRPIWKRVVETGVCFALNRPRAITSTSSPGLNDSVPSSRPAALKTRTTPSMERQSRETPPPSAESLLGPRGVSRLRRLGCGTSVAKAGQSRADVRFAPVILPSAGSIVGEPDETGISRNLASKGQSFGNGVEAKSGIAAGARSAAREGSTRGEPVGRPWAGSEGGWGE